MFPEGVLASAIALLSQFFAASAGVSGIFSAGRDSLVFCAGFAAGLVDDPAEVEIQNCNQYTVRLAVQETDFGYLPKQTLILRLLSLVS